MTQPNEQPQTTDLFFGTWVLDPTQSAYEAGQPPQSGSYRIDPESDSLKFTMDWVDANGEQHHMVYFTVPDGKEHPYENPAITDTIATTRIDAYRLETRSTKNGKVIAIGTRTLSADGSTMTILQTSVGENGDLYNNVSVYIKRRE